MHPFRTRTKAWRPYSWRDAFAAMALAFVGTTTTCVATADIWNAEEPFSPRSMELGWLRLVLCEHEDMQALSRG
jgi:hypothetical protein